ncbi:MAG: hypothetical protein FJ404_16655 [Verrucomicrobia bacterium]|nr:hypothetical protein [Verrucomicrobiota bacterium]
MNTFSISRLAPLLGVVLCAASLTLQAAPSFKQALEALRATGPEGAGQAQAEQAWRVVAQQKPDKLLAVLSAMNGAHDLALNWLRPAAESIADRAIASGSLPTAALERFSTDFKQHSRARRLAWELIARADMAKAQSMLPKYLGDPGADLRREAIAQVIQAGDQSIKNGQKPEAIAHYRRALTHAREADQLEDLAKKLKEQGETVALAAQFAWVKDWKVVGPFNNLGGVGYDTPFGPETQGLDLQAYEGAQGKVSWIPFAATDDYGTVDFNKPFTKLKGVAGYATSTLVSTKAQDVVIRLGSQNAWKVWLNGKLLFGRDEYHRGREIDQYQLPAKLKKGDNVLLIKACQNEQKEEWTQEWQFSLRVTTPAGEPIRFDTFQRAQLD